jgi:putative YhdH/YhfP family quinone oxidoreductase
MAPEAGLPTGRAVVGETIDGEWTVHVRALEPAWLAGDIEGESLVEVEWSTLNFKDGLAARGPKAKVARLDPLVLGVDLAGTVREPGAGGPPAGTRVVAGGFGLGERHHGGFATSARVPSAWLVPLPDELSTRDAMAIGTAGFTAALCVLALERHGLRPGDGPVLVLGAAGGVGSVAVDLLAGLGHEVVASTGGGDHDLLRRLGASQIVSRAETSAEGDRPLESQRWAGCVDAVGGASLAYALRTLRYGAAVAATGNVGGAELHTTVFPFILRNVALLGVDSVEAPAGLRAEVWGRLATDLRPRHLDLLTRELTLDEVPEALATQGAGAGQGRTIVRTTPT